MLYGDYFGVADFIRSVGKYRKCSALVVFGIYNIYRFIICDHFLLYIYA